MKAIFLDRDGTIIVNPPDERVDRMDKVALLPKTIQALKKLASLDYGVFVVTNQAGIAEGRISQEQFYEIHNAVLELIAPSGIQIIKTYMCPHVDADKCDCRKPKPTMLLEAANQFNIDLSSSWMIGDWATDIQTGINAGTKTIWINHTASPDDLVKPTYYAKDILDAVEYISRGS